MSYQTRNQQTGPLFRGYQIFCDHLMITGRIKFQMVLPRRP